MALTVVPTKQASRLRDGLAWAHDPQPDRVWKVDGLLEEESRLVIAAPEGFGKSLLALTMGVQAAMGLKVLGRWQPALPQLTYYYDCEMPAASIRRRVRQLAISAKLEAGAIAIAHEPDGMDLTSKQEQRRITEELEELPPDILIVDPLYKLFAGDIREERHVKPALLFLDRLRGRFGCAIVLLTHMRKRMSGETERGRDLSDLLGSSVLARWAEMIWYIGEAEATVRKDRDDTIGLGTTFTLLKGGEWPIGLAVGEKELSVKIVEFIELEGRPVTGGQIVQAVGLRKATVIEAIRDLRESGRLEQTEGGKWKLTAGFSFIP